MGNCVLRTTPRWNPRIPSTQAAFNSTSATTYFPEWSRNKVPENQADYLPASVLRLFLYLSIQHIFSHCSGKDFLHLFSKCYAWNSSSSSIWKLVLTSITPVFRPHFRHLESKNLERVTVICGVTSLPGDSDEW